MSMQRKHLVCTYDEYSANDIFNQILSYTIDSILSNPEVSKETKATIKKQKVFFYGIDAKPPTKEKIRICIPKRKKRRSTRRRLPKWNIRGIRD